MLDFKPSFKNPLRLIINTCIFIFVILLMSYVGIRIIIAYDTTQLSKEPLINLADDVKLLSLAVFNFVQPFLQLVIILIILEWLLNKFGLSLRTDSLKLDWNVQTIIALIVIISFSLAALSGVTGASMLKDVALVVVGFYFGTQKKSVEGTTQNDRPSSIEDSFNKME